MNILHVTMVDGKPTAYSVTTDDNKPVVATQEIGKAIVHQEIKTYGGDTEGWSADLDEMCAELENQA